MIRALQQRAREKGVATLFAHTRALAFFERLGFARCDRKSFPEKIWRDCRTCPVRDHCDEQAVVISLRPNGSRPCR
jgi:amino-acid N-acetyltransferase